MRDGGRTLVILGGSDGSARTYLRARAMGLRTVCVDHGRRPMAATFADEVISVDTREPELVAAALAGRVNDIAGVVSPASDVALPALAWLVRHWGLPETVPEPALRASVDKAYFRAVCDRLGFPSHRYATGSSAEEIDLAAADLPFPVLVKPLDAQSSRGIRICPRPESVAAAAGEAIGHSDRGVAVVEEYVSGDHHSVEAILDEGKVAFLAVSARRLGPHPHTATASHLIPAGLPDAVHRRIENMLTTLCTELGYRRGPLNADLVIDAAGGVHLIEMGARPGGNGMAELIDHAYGVDVTRAAVAAAVGAPFTLTPTRSRTVLLHLVYAPRVGVLAGVSGTDEVRAMPEVSELELFARPGRLLLPFAYAANKLGHAILVGEDPDHLRATADRVERVLEVTYE